MPPPRGPRSMVLLWTAAASGPVPAMVGARSVVDAGTVTVMVPRSALSEGALVGRLAQTAPSPPLAQLWEVPLRVVLKPEVHVSRLTGPPAAAAAVPVTSAL